jgi:hypothetical protein
MRETRWKKPLLGWKANIEAGAPEKTKIRSYNGPHAAWLTYQANVHFVRCGHDVFSAHPKNRQLRRKPWPCEQSSAAVHVEAGVGPDILSLSRWYGRISANQRRKQRVDGLSDSELGRLRSGTHTGRPSGSGSFLSKLEGLLGHRVRPLLAGRPRKGKRSQKRKKSHH